MVSSLPSPSLPSPLPSPMAAMARRSRIPATPGSLAGPMVRDSCAVDCSAQGLLAYTCGSAITVVDVGSMQLVHTLLYGDRPGSPATAVQFLPEGLNRELAEEPHLLLAAGDKMGRIAIWDVVVEKVKTWLVMDKPPGKIEELRWVMRHPWLLAALCGPAQAVLWDRQQERIIWRYEAANQEPLMSIACDPHDPSRVCITGAKGALVSLSITGCREEDILSSVQKLPLSEPRERAPGKEGKDPTDPNAILRCLFAPRTRGMLFVLLPREILIYDIQFQRIIANTVLPRGYVRFVNIVVPVDGNVIYCLHADSSLSAWQRKPHQQSYVLRHVQQLVPSQGSASPNGQVIGLMHCPQPSLPQHAIDYAVSERSYSKSYSIGRSTSREALDSPSEKFLHSNFGSSKSLGSTESSSYIDNSPDSSSSMLMVLTDDGKLWQWLATEELPEDQNELHQLDGVVEDLRKISLASASPGDVFLPTTEDWMLSFRIVLQGMMHALSSSITTLAVPTPSLLATTPGVGILGQGAATAVPLVALATSGGSVELFDTASHAICSSLAIHNSMVRGVRWLGNQRIVSFSFTEVKAKAGGFNNRIVLTDVRSGQSRPFRVLPLPDRCPMRGLRSSPSGRYLLILFRGDLAEVWAMTRNPTMLRSLALPFMVMEWTLPPLPNSSEPSSPMMAPLSTQTRVGMGLHMPISPMPGGEAAKRLDPGSEEPAESFAFALVNGSLGVFELRGRRVRDFRPKWPAASFVAPAQVTAMAYRLPHVVMGDRLGNVRWWDVTTGQAATFNTHRGTIKRIRFAPTLPSVHSRGRVILLFGDHSFALFDLDAGEIVPNVLVQKEFVNLAALELDWLPLQGDVHYWPEASPQLLCVAVADGSLRLLEIQTSAPLKGIRPESIQVAAWQRFRPSPLSSVALLPAPHALALRLLLQQGVKPSWLEQPERPPRDIGDLRRHMLDTSPLPSVGESGVMEVLLKGLESHRIAGRLMDVEEARKYARVCRRGVAARCAFVAAHFGDMAEAEFWLQLPNALHLLSQGSAGPRAFWADADKVAGFEVFSEQEANEEAKTPFASSRRGIGKPSALYFKDENGALESPVSFDTEWGEQGVVRAAALARIEWHEKLPGADVAQKRIHEFIAVGDYEAAVTLLLAAPPDSPTFFVDALRAVALASAVSPAMHELAVKVIAANMVQSQEPLAGIHLLCAVGRYQEACSQLQDAGRWVDACTLAATHLSGSDRARVLLRWAQHSLNNEHDLWRAMTLFVASGKLASALSAVREARQPDTGIMFLLACHEARQIELQAVPREIVLSLPEIAKECTEKDSSGAEEQSEGGGEVESSAEQDDRNEEKEGDNGKQLTWDSLDLPGDLHNLMKEVQEIYSFFEEYQRWLVHLSLFPSR